MRQVILALLVLLGVGLVWAQEKPAKPQTTAFTDAQLLKVERHKTAILQYQLALSQLEQRKALLQAEETALNLELCGKGGTFDYGLSACSAPVASPAKPQPLKE